MVGRKSQWGLASGCCCPKRGRPPIALANIIQVVNKRAQSAEMPSKLHRYLGWRSDQNTLIPNLVYSFLKRRKHFIQTT